MFRNQMGIIAAMESADNEGVDLNEVESAETATAVSEETAELTTEATGVDATAAQVGEAVEAGDQLEEIAEVAVDAVESGEGMDETAAAMASIAIESIRNRLGFRGTQKLVPALESFGNTNTKLVSTRLVIEGIGDTLKSIWAAIKAAAARLWDKIKSFFASLFNSATLLSKHIAGLKERARNMPSSVTPKEKKLKSASLAKAISVKGKANLDSMNTIAKNTFGLAAVADVMASSSRSVVSEAEKLASKEINEANVAAYLASQTNAATEIAKVMSANFQTADASFAPNALNAVFKTKKPKKGSTVVRAAYGPFIGSTVMTLEIDTVGKDKTFSITIAGVPSETKIAEEVEALELSEVRSLLDDASKTVNALVDFKKTQANMDAITKSINKVADTVMTNAQKILEKTGSSTDTRQGLAELKENVGNTISDLNTMGSRVPSLIFSVCKHAADYASMSMRNLGEKAAK